MSHSDVMVSVQNLQKYYGDFHALKGITTTVQRGQVVGLLGPNGAGKSTLMRVMTGYLPASSGQVEIGGHVVSGEPLQVQELLGYLPESAPLYDDMVVYDFLHYIGTLRGLSGDALESAMADAGRRCGLEPVVGKHIRELSKGYRQRVGLAQAIIHRPPLLILDEPTTGLDPNQILEIRQLIKELGREQTVILSTHIMQEVQAVCDRVLIISQGQLVRDGTVDELVSDGAAQCRVSVVAKPKQDKAVQDLAKALQSLKSVVSVASESSSDAAQTKFSVTAKNDPREAVFDTIADGGWRILEMKLEQESLEEAFRRITA